MSRFSVTEKQDRYNSFLKDVESIGGEQYEGIWGWAQGNDWDDEETDVLELDGPIDALYGFSIR